MAAFEIKEESGRAYVKTPYNPKFVGRIKQVGGRKWDQQRGAWSVPAAEIPTIREIMMDVYGETDIIQGHIVATIKFNETETGDRGPIVLYGKVVASAWGRDSGAKPGDDVAVVSGEIRSGGSAKNWQTVIEEGTVVRIRNLTEAAMAIPTKYSITMIDIMDDKNERELLLAERERLISRIAEIDRLLGQ